MIPSADEMWLPTGSFWTQPAGEAHVTAADGSNNMAYIEIEEGPYLVRPTEKAFDNGERPVNIAASNLVWLGASDITWVNQSGGVSPADEPQIAFLWSNPLDDPSQGALVKLPAGFTGKIRSHGSTFRAVVIQGRLQYQVGETEVKTLEPGSYFSSQGEVVHQVSSEADTESILCVRREGPLDIIPVPLGK